VHAADYNASILEGRRVEFISKNIFLILIAAISGGMLLWPLVRKGTGGPWVNTLQATQLMNRDDALVLDLRPAAEFAGGHILGARNIPLADMARRAGELDKYKSKPVIVYCGAGNSSGAGVALLRKGGFANVVNLSGGFAAWQQAGLPVEK
jgi:rhodanese-related sulfurtransferase